MLLSFLNLISKINTKYDYVPLCHENGVEVDLYLNKNIQAKACIYFLYGGRWTTGRKEQFRFMAHKFLKAGYNVAIADYRKHPDVKFPEFVEDAARGLVCIDQYFKKMKTSMYLYIMGHSSGAHLGAMLCTESHYLSQAGGSINLISGFIGVSGPYKFIDYIKEGDDLSIMFGPSEKYPDSQPVLLAKQAANMPPMLLIHGGKDKSVSPQNTLQLAEVVQKKSRVKPLIILGLSHINIILAFALPFWPKQTKTMMDAINDFTK